MHNIPSATIELVLLASPPALLCRLLPLKDRSISSAAIYDALSSKNIGDSVSLLRSFGVFIPVSKSPVALPLTLPLGFGNVIPSADESDRWTSPC